MARAPRETTIATLPQPGSELRIARDLPTLRDLTTDKLREAILTQRFKPGHHLVERDLCAQTGVSRSSVREALRHLEAEGLVERRDSRGLYVTEITREEARQIYEVRAAIEPELARLFAERADETHFAELASTLTALEQAVAGRDTAGYVRALDAFFDTLIDGSGNAIARRIVRTLRARISFLRAITTARADSAREQETIALMRAIAADARGRDGNGARTKCRAFVERSAEFALKVLSEQSSGRGE